MGEANWLRGKRVLLSGANGIVGHHLARSIRSHLGDDGLLTCLSRKPVAVEEKSVTWLQVDLRHKNVFPRADILFHCAPIWLLSDQLEGLTGNGLGRLLAFSSTSAVTKSASRDETDRKLSEQMRESEHSVKTRCQELGLTYTLFRPTMIYGYSEDQNITKIAKFIARFRFFFVAGKAQGSRQPVHVDDLVAASIRAINSQSTENRAYDLPGGETLSYREMVVRIFRALGLRPNIFSIPVFMYRVCLQALALFPGRFSYTSGMADRMNQDLSFACDDAKSDFGYSPQGFLLDPRRDLGRVMR